MSTGMAGMPNVTGYESHNRPTAAKPSASEVPYLQSDQALEATALAGSAAIRRIIAERNELKRERERLYGSILELRRENEKATNLCDHYKQLATELLVQLKQMHQAIQDASSKARQLTAFVPENPDAALVSLAQRFAAPPSAR